MYNNSAGGVGISVGNKAQYEFGILNMASCVAASQQYLIALDLILGPMNT